MYVQERSIAVGMSFQPTYVSVNIQRLKILLNRCKSSINKGFQQINYVSEKSQVKSHVINSIPLLRLHPEETRQWTIRIPNNGKDHASNLIQLPIGPISTDILPNINLINSQIQNEKITFPPQNFKNLLPTPCINSNSNMTLVSEQNFRQELCVGSPNSIHQAYEYIKNDDNRATTAIQNPPEIRLCNSQCFDCSFSIDDFDINNGHEFTVNDDDSGILCNSCGLNENCVSAENTFELSPNFHYDEMYAEYHNHDDPQDDDIGLYNISAHNGSSIDIRKNFS